MPIITSTMLHYDPKTFVVWTTTPLQPARPAVTVSEPSLARTLAAVAAAGLAPRLVELALSRRPR